MKYYKFVFLFLILLYGNRSYTQNTVSCWLTTADKSSLLAKQQLQYKFSNTGDKGLPVISIDSNQKFQTMDGFGFALTGGSAMHLIRMSAIERAKIIKELFATDGNNIGISYLRISIGASDLNDHVFSYDDMPEGQTDSNLLKFNLNQDEMDVIPVLKEILSINPNIKILGSPWSAPAWMKTNNNIQGGKLKSEYYSIYAKYFLKYITEMKKKGITIDAVTLQNEPFNDGNTPSMQMFAKEQALFIKKDIGPLFKLNGVTTKIILYDHNCDAPEYPISILTDQAARQYINGSGFHLYAGNITALTKVHTAFPGKDLYFTEMMATSRNGFNIANPVDRILIGATRNWSRNVILWNLAADSNNNPHTDNGGCAMCQGAIAIDGNTITRNIAYYVIAHASKFIPMGSVRIGSSSSGTLPNVAFKTPEGKIVVIVANEGEVPESFTISLGGKIIQPTLMNSAVATYVW